MMTRGIAYRSIRAFLVLMYPAVAIATAPQLGVEFIEYKASTIAAVAVLILVGGMTGLVHRLKQEYDDYGELQHPKLFVASNLFGAVAGGVVSFLVSASLFNTAEWRAAFIVVCAYAGTLFLEAVFDWVVEKFFPSKKSAFPRRRDSDFKRTQTGRPPSPEPPLDCDITEELLPPLPKPPRSPK